MIDFQRLTPENQENYQRIMSACPPRSCEYSFVNLYCWGLQKMAFFEDCIAFFSHFEGRSVYPYPVGMGNRKAVVEAVLADARERGIPCRLVGMTAGDCQELENWFPWEFHFRADRNSFDYVYSIDDLADLKGRTFQKKRNHVNRFCQEHPEYQILPLNADTMHQARELAANWYLERKASDPQGDYLLESVALNRALHHYDALGLDGVVLAVNGEVKAITLGSRLSADTFDVHFEKAAGDSDGAYAVINREFARYLRGKYPNLLYLNREDDMGLEGLRKAKLSYAPHHLEEKYWAYSRRDHLLDEDPESSS